MNAVVERTLFRSTAAASVDADTGGGYMDEILKRLGVLETIVVDVRLQVTSILALVPTFATKTELQATKAELKADIQAVSEKLGAVTSTLPQLATKADVDAISAVLPHLATKAEVDAITSMLPHLSTKAEVGVITAVLPHLATKADFLATRAEMQAMHSSLIKWMVGTAIATASLAAAITSAVSKLI